MCQFLVFNNETTLEKNNYFSFVFINNRLHLIHQDKSKRVVVKNNWQLGKRCRSENVYTGNVMVISLVLFYCFINNIGRGCCQQYLMYCSKIFPSSTLLLIYIQEEFEDTKVVIRIRISKKNRQRNGQKKKYKRTNNGQQNIHIKLKIEWHEPH
jgi:hypothetical protein